MEPDLSLTKLSGNDCDEGDCPAGHLSSRGTLVFQGPGLAEAKGLRLGAGEQAVEVSVDLVRETLDALGR